MGDKEKYRIGLQKPGKLPDRSKEIQKTFYSLLPFSDRLMIASQIEIILPLAFKNGLYR